MANVKREKTSHICIKNSVIGQKITKSREINVTEQELICYYMSYLL